MKHQFLHIALLLLVIFTVTIVPFNALHHHAENEHAAVLHAHDIDSHHHCELDDYFCQTDVNTPCGHNSHIQKTIEKCFSCEFHFIKHFETGQSIAQLIQENSSPLFTAFISEKLHQAIILLSNKGPPSLV